jgi:Tol biopolymer transport system component
MDTKRNLTEAIVETEEIIGTFTWSPEGERIAYVASGKDGYRLFIINAEGENSYVLPDVNLTLAQLAWSPDGKYLVFVSTQDRNLKLLMLSTNCLPEEIKISHSNCDNRLYEIATDIVQGYDPVWSPNGKQLLFEVGGNNAPGIYTINMLCFTDTAEMCDNQPQRLYDENWDTNPIWSPDSRLIAFETYRNFNVDIYVMNADGSNRRQITTNDDWDGHALWSPDSQQLIYVSAKNDNYDLYTLETACFLTNSSCDERRLTNSLNAEDYPAWSTVGDVLSFISSGQSNRQVFAIEATCINTGDDVDCSQKDRLLISATELYGVPQWQP